MPDIATKSSQSASTPSTTSPTANDNHANAYDITSSSQWDSYAKYRPRYPPELFQRIYDFHAARQGTFEVAHDAGCGPGITAAILGQKFQTVMCSDFSARAVDTARQNLSRPIHSGTRYIFQHASAEDMTWLDENSVDLVTMSECLHWTDTPKTTASINRVLKPGSTFAAWYYGNPQFPENDELWATFLETLARWCKLRASWSRESNRTLWVENTGYDCIALTGSEGWAPGVRRVKFNTNGSRMPWIRDKDLAHMQFERQVGPNDVLEDVEEAKEWEQQVGLDWFTGWFESLFPRLDHDYLTHQLAKIEKALSEQRTTRAVWPVRTPQKHIP